MVTIGSIQNEIANTINQITSIEIGIGNVSVPIITTTSGGSVTDSLGNVWTLNVSGYLYENNKIVADGGGTSLLASINGVIWAQANSTKNWYINVNGLFEPSGGKSPPIGQEITIPVAQQKLANIVVALKSTSSNVGNLPPPQFDVLGKLVLA